MKKVLEKCPVCDAKVVISEIECEACGTKVVSKFDIPKGFDIDEDIMNFIKVFIFTEGSIKQSEKLLNCSYPKIKNLLKKAKAALGLDELNINKPDKGDVESVVDLLKDGAIDVEEALRKLKN